MGNAMQRRSLGLLNPNKYLSIVVVVVVKEHKAARYCTIY